MKIISVIYLLLAGMVAMAFARDYNYEDSSSSSSESVSKEQKSRGRIRRIDSGSPERGNQNKKTKSNPKKVICLFKPRSSVHKHSNDCPDYNSKNSKKAPSPSSSSQSKYRTVGTTRSQTAGGNKDPEYKSFKSTKKSSFRYASLTESRKPNQLTVGLVDE